MFCRKCGNELEETAKFCHKCGISTSTEEVVYEHAKETKKVDNNVIKYTLKPTFNYGYKIFGNVVYVLIFILAIGVALLEDFDIEEIGALFTRVIASVPFIVIVIVYLLIKLIFDKKQYERLEYNFYHNKLEYIDGFINKEQKELKYKNIREVTMSQNILERIFKVGTIKIFTNASSGVYGGSNHRNMNGKNGIMIHCVTDVKDKYQKVKQIIDEGTEE